MSTHMVRWSVNNGTNLYTALPVLKVMVDGVKAEVKVPTEVTCSLGGRSVPISVTASAVPFGDIKVKLLTSSTKNGDKTVQESVGITPDTNEVVLKVGTSEGVLGFACNTTITGTKLKYNLDGSDKLQFTIPSEVTVKGQKAGTRPDAPKMTLAGVASASTPSKTVVEGECPGMGASWICLTPVSWKASILGKATDVRSAAAKFVKGAEGNYKNQQWYYQSV